MFCSAGAARHLRASHLILSHRLLPPVYVKNTKRALSEAVGTAPLKHAHITSTDLATPQDIFRPTAMWLASKQKYLDPDKVLYQLPRSRDLTPGHQRGKLKVALFVVTPAFYHLFSNGHPFHAAAVERIFRSENQPVTCKTIVAVVDALPALKEASSVAGQQQAVSGYEGLGVFVSDHFETIAHDARIADGTRVIRFRGSNDIMMKGRRHVVDYQAPLANTIFVNGQESTMFAQVWRYNDKDAFLPVDNTYEELSGIEIPINSGTTDRYRAIPGILNVDLTRLTSPAIIESSMGNIIRQIRTGDGKIISASQELEAIVPPLVKSYQTELPGGEFRVYALVYAPKNHKIAPENQHAEMAFSMKSRRETNILDRGASVSDWVLRKHLFRRLLARGARLHRVTSGGAGWGQKAGLLSLDPRTDVVEWKTSADVSELSFDLETGSLSMPEPKKLFPPGHIVQFVGRWFDPTGNQSDALTIADIPRSTTFRRKDYFHDSKVQTICLGNTVLPETPTEHTNKSGKVVKHKFLPNRFGFLSTKAWSMSAQPAAKRRASKGGRRGKHTTVIEVPNSNMKMSYRAGGVAFVSSLHPGSIDPTKPSLSHLVYRLEQLKEKYARLFGVSIRQDMPSTFQELTLWFKHNFSVEVAHLGDLDEDLQQRVLKAGRQGFMVEKPEAGRPSILTLYRRRNQHSVTLVTKVGIMPSHMDVDTEYLDDLDGSEPPVDSGGPTGLPIRYPYSSAPGSRDSVTDLVSSVESEMHQLDGNPIPLKSIDEAGSSVLYSKSREEEEIQILNQLFEDLDE